jgi:hypothetical protein
METGPLAGLLLARAVAPAMVSARGGLLALTATSMRPKRRSTQRTIASTSPSRVWSHR